ncbi:MAG TPA: DUF4349 domain-containing protein [Acidimicrobiales bacterium]|nr:DUF4349 domain-containing protein [Acidimicrobiales bacterium]
MGRKASVVAGLVGLLVVAGAVVTATDGRDEARDGGEVASTAAVDSGRAADGAASRPSGELAVGAPAPPVGPGLPGAVDPAGPRVVRTADLALEVAEGRFGSAFDRVAAIAITSGGYVTSSSTTGEGGRRARSGQLTLRVPSDRFEDARRALRQLGEVDQESLRGEDVSGQLVDYEARLRSLRAQEESLQALLGRAANVGEVLQVQTALFNVRQQIEQLEAQRAQLDQAAALATIQVSLYEPGASFVLRPEPEPATGLAASFQRAVDGALAVVGGMIVVVGWATPLAVLGGLAWLIARWRRRPAAPAAPVTS